MFKSIGGRLVASLAFFALLEGLCLGIYFMSIRTMQMPALTVVWQFVLITLGMIILAGLLAYAVGRGITSPLKRLNKFVGGMSADTLGRKAPIMGDDEISELVIGINHMNERLAAELARMTSQLDRMQLILARMQDGIILVDGEGSITTINPAAEQIFNLEARTVIGSSFIEAVRDYEIEQPVRLCLKNKRPQQQYIDLRHKGLYLGQVVNSLASEPGCLVLIQDLSRLKKLESVRRDFVANISHELRTPVASIKLLAETLREGALGDEKVSLDFINRIGRETEKLGEIVDGMTALARIESGDAKLEKKPVDMAEIIRRALDRLHSQLEGKKLEIESNLGDDSRLVMADAGQIEQVVYNLLHNAIKFTPAGGRVSISTRLDSSSMLVTVSDNGTGISPEDLPRVFERFYKADRSRSSGGTGLGLAIARHIVEAHGGRIWAGSPADQGARIHFRLPV